MRTNRLLLMMAFAKTVLVATTSHSADWKIHVQWCEANAGHDVPRVECQVKNMPDGQVRDNRSPAELVSAARKSVSEGKCDEAILWLTEGCQCHNFGAQTEIRNGRDEVCAYLKK
ncbi:hypothetical protein HY478_03105 [Candidatus Uhrbacteria bacterium]|nr:hypothetical protein [Candidatus Uhrbacteria bacterium]